mmetsp:Transcript_53830/g.120904  ORF Transcript_53830/g.120904 Transcript_53830/m.120904 type:complete len:101 (-) Transcript_53830:15-317(-)
MAFLDFSNLSNVGIGSYVTVIFVTLASTSPYFGIIDDLSTKAPKDFEPCNDGCLFIRFFSSGKLPSTQVRNLDPTRDSHWPAFAFVQNGQNITYHSLDFN